MTGTNGKAAGKAAGVIRVYWAGDEALVRALSDSAHCEAEWVRAETIPAHEAEDETARALEAGIRPVWLLEDLHALRCVALEDLHPHTVIIADAIPFHRVVSYFVDRVAGIVFKSDGPGAVCAAVESAVAGETYVSPTVESVMARYPTPKEYEVLDALFEHPDASSREVGNRIGISKSGLKYRLLKLYARAGVSSRPGLILRSLQNDWMRPAEAGVDVHGADPGPLADMPEPERELLAALFRFPDAGNGELGDLINITESAVRSRLRTMYARMGVNGRTGLVLEAARCGWLRDKSWQVQYVFKQI
jgi:DNA-binding CsgD family transcriptional regulator